MNTSEHGDEMVVVEKHPIFVKLVRNGNSVYLNFSKEALAWLQETEKNGQINDDTVFAMVPEVRKKDGKRYFGIGTVD